VPFWWPLVSVRTPQGRPHLVSGLPGEGWHDMAVDVGGCPHLRVAEQLHGDPRVHASGEQQCRRRVPSVVQADLPDSGRVQEGSTVERPVGRSAPAAAIVGDIHALVRLPASDL
jgi:hypothetical protein